LIIDRGMKPKKQIYIPMILEGFDCIDLISYYLNGKSIIMLDFKIMLDFITF